MTMVLDASAVIALVRDEPGASRVRELLESSDVTATVAGHISAVNLTEVLQQLGEPPPVIGGSVPDIDSVPYDSEQAGLSAAMLMPTRAVGLSLADRACLALAKMMSLPAVTADHLWSEVDVGVEVIQIR